MQRRKFLQNVMPAAALFPGLLNGFSVQAFGSSAFLRGLDGAADNDHVLVLVQLNGGNDGLNTLIPLETYGDYYGLRSNIAIPEGKVLKLNKFDKAGLHPAFTGMQQLYNEEKLAVMQAVGYPSPNGSHFRSMDIWLTGADSNQYLNTGWAGRFLGETFTNFPNGYPNEVMPDPLAIQIGSVLSPVFMAPGGLTAMAVPSDTDFYNLINGITEAVPNTPMGTELTYLRTVARQTNKYADVIVAAAKKITRQGPYPANNSLAAQLKTVARLIAGGLKTRVYMVSMGGFDTHGGQVEAGNTVSGSHANLLKQLSDAITAFMGDIKQLGVSQKVMGMTFSEFGRRIRSNGSAGTDHGTAQPVFVFGDYAKQGVLGQNPDLSASIDVGGNVAMQYDFRSVYSTILRDWFCVAPNDVQTMLLKNYQYLPFIKTTACNNTIDDLNNIGDKLIMNYPNPFDQYTKITFKTGGGHTLVQVFDTTGRLIMVPVDEDYLAGTYTITVNTSGMSSGIYYARFQNQSVQQVRTMLKVKQ
ncbi:DUF1501 domain-containing protein [Deminuibacter soli]|uniref:DUF1501 domain-containing protein n=1 Tax=Deminuibacter soli TaxID=2291815 RepID=A0A3E1NPF2_9BACT|nr:DUF1501 domain-containing protein [Deminuibacter soli]RFM29819.1 DUF1501 domain-containing protein [Deminuibacter soli]